MLDTNLAQAAVVYGCAGKFPPFFSFQLQAPVLQYSFNEASTGDSRDLQFCNMTKTLQTLLCSTNFNAVYYINVYQKSSNQIVSFTKHDQTVMNFEKFGIKKIKTENNMFTL